MHTWHYRSISWLLVSLMLLTLLPIPTFASTQTAIPLDQAIQIVKQNFKVPAEYTSFTSGYNKVDNLQSWSLSWNNPDSSGGNFSAQVDAQTGEVISMNTWKPETVPHNRIPSISMAQAQAIGFDLLQRLIPSRVSSLVLIPDSQFISLTSFGSSTYSVRWQRLVNNIPVIGEGANMDISVDNGQVLNYSCNWTNLDMPSPASIITPDMARQAFIKEGFIQLQYILPSHIVPPAEQQNQSPLLVYRIDHPSNGVIDALTGKAIVPEPGQWLMGGGGGAGMNMSNNKTSLADTSNVPLTPQETEEIAQNSNLISQEEAVGVVKKWVGISENLNLCSANLEKDWRDPNVRIWNLSWSSTSSSATSDIKVAVPYKNDASSSAPSQSTLPLNLYGRVNARTGELVGFNLDLPPHSTAATALTQTAAKNLADNFLKQVQPQHFSEFKFDDRNSNQEIVNTKLPWANTTWSFNYFRTVNGIKFSGNGADISVDRASQKVTAYNLNWVDKDFPSAQGIVGLDRANDLYLQTTPLTLSYSSFYRTGGKPPEMRLVYQPQNQPSQPYISMINALTGEKLDDQGQPISNKVRVHIFNDISGNFAEKEISLLGQAGLMSDYGDSFHPNENIRLVVLLRAMLDSASGIDNTRDLSDQEVMKRALELGWIKENLAPDSAMSRGLLSQLMVRSLGLEYVAKLPDIYQLPYQDGASLDADLKGYAALTWGLGIIRGDSVNFETQHIVSRAEAAMALVHTLGVKTQP